MKLQHHKFFVEKFTGLTASRIVGSQLTSLPPALSTIIVRTLSPIIFTLSPTSPLVLEVLHQAGLESPTDFSYIITISQLPLSNSALPRHRPPPLGTNSLHIGGLEEGSNSAQLLLKIPSVGHFQTLYFFVQLLTLDI